MNRPELTKPMADFATADLCDAHGDIISVCAPVFQDFGALPAFKGPVLTVLAFEDNSKVREMLETPGEGRVLVVDGGGSTRCALVGGNLGVLAEKNGWAGILVHGYVRDAVELAVAKVGVKALGTCPRKSDKKDRGRVGETLTFAGVTFRPGDWVYADADGVILAPNRLD